MIAAGLMNAIDVIFLLVGTALLVFLTLVLARKLTLDAVALEQTRPGLMGQVIYYVSKWITIIGIVYLALVYLPTYLPPRWVERIFQRKQVARRVQVAGGWEEMLRQTSMFLSANTNLRSSFILPRAHTNIYLPPAIETLKPRYIVIDSYGGLSTVRLHVFGTHSTGHRDPAFYSLVVVPNAPKTNIVELLRQRYGERQAIHQITNGVFEVY